MDAVRKRRRRLIAGFPYFAALACFELIAEPLYALPPYESWK